MKAELIDFNDGVARYRVNETPPETAEITKYHPKRTLSANDKYQVTIGEIAQILGVPKIEIHNKLLNDLGIYHLDIQGKPLVAILEDDLDYMKMSNIHLQPTQKTRTLDNGKLYRVYYVLKGSSEMNAQEFARLCDMAILELEDLK